MTVFRVLFVDPAGWQGKSTGNRPYPNVGIAYLAAAIQDAGHEVGLIDLNNVQMTDEDIVNKTTLFKPDIVAISIKTATIDSARYVGKLVKSAFPYVKIVVGGPHVTLGCLELSQEKWVDAAFLGEGEAKFLEFCSMLSRGNYKATSDNCGINAKFYIEMSESFVASLDSLHFPAYNIFSKDVFNWVQSSYPLVTSRGCPYKCSYCSVPRLSGGIIRLRSPENVIEELKHAQAMYGITGFEIIDDAFNVDLARCKKFCKMLLAENLKLVWTCPNGLRADRVDDELADLMFKSGCQEVMIGIETADPQLLSTVNKRETLEDIESGIRTFQRAGIRVGGYFIIGLPGDSFHSQEMSIEFSNKMGIAAHFNLLVPYPGTEIWEKLVKDKFSVKDIEGSSHFSGALIGYESIVKMGTYTIPELKRTFEMIHTRLGRPDMIISHNSSQTSKYLKWFWFLWKYDRRGLIKKLVCRLRLLL